MYYLLFNNSPALLGAISWLDLTALLGIIAILVYIYRFSRSRVTKDDLDLQLEKKASKNMVESGFKLRDTKIDHVYKMSELQDEHIKDKLDEQFAILDTVQTDIKTILRRLK